MENDQYNVYFFNRLHFKFSNEKFANEVKEDFLNNGNIDFKQTRNLCNFLDGKIRYEANGFKLFEFQGQDSFHLIFTFDSEMLITRLLDKYFELKGFKMTYDYYNKKHFGHYCGTFIYDSLRGNRKIVYEGNTVIKPKYNTTSFTYPNVFLYLEARYGKQLLIDNEMWFDENRKIWLFVI